MTSPGQNAKHIKWYRGGATMKDSAIEQIADAEGRTAVTKDDDFRLMPEMAGDRNPVDAA